MAASSLAVTVSTRVWIVLATHDLRTRHTVTKRPLATDTARGRCIPALGRVAAGGVGDFACRPLVVGAACAVVWARAVTLALDAGGRADGHHNQVLRGATYGHLQEQRQESQSRERKQRLLLQ